MERERDVTVSFSTPLISLHKRIHVLHAPSAKINEAIVWPHLLGHWTFRPIRIFSVIKLGHLLGQFSCVRHLSLDLIHQNDTHLSRAFKLVIGCQ